MAHDTAIRHDKPDRHFVNGCLYRKLPDQVAVALHRLLFRPGDGDPGSLDHGNVGKFVQATEGEGLVRHYNAADVFVFPSRTDTFGLVLLEALACGVPVAAYPVMGPIDVITGDKVGRLDEDLGAAIDGALLLEKRDCLAFAEKFSWAACASQFRRYLFPIKHPEPYTSEEALSVRR